MRASQEPSGGILGYSRRVSFSSVVACFRPRCRCSGTRPSPWGDASATSSGSMRSFPKNTAQVDLLCPHHQRRAFWVGSHKLLLSLSGWNMNLSRPSWRMGCCVEQEWRRWRWERRIHPLQTLLREDEVLWRGRKKLWSHGQKPLAAFLSQLSSCCPGDGKLKGLFFPVVIFIYYIGICSGWSITRHYCRTLMSESSWKERKYAKITSSLMDESPPFSCSSQFYCLFKVQCGHSCFMACVQLPRAVSTQALSGAGFLKMINRATDAVSKMTIKMNESDVVSSAGNNQCCC